MIRLRDILAFLRDAAAAVLYTAAADALETRARLAAGAERCPGDGEGLMDVADAVAETPIHDALHAEWRRNANDYARAVADLDAAETVADLAYVGGWDQ